VETHRVLARQRPDLVVLNPLVMQPASTEMELLEELQRDDDPVPVIVLVENLESFHAANSSRIPIRDFMAKPHSPDELIPRVQLALLHRTKHLSLHQRTQELEGQVSIDFKTSLISERHFKSILTMEFKRSQRHNNALSLLLVDVDNFKTINDNTDYSFGDEVLIQVAKALKNTIRATDYAARFGGDEFVLLLPHTTPAEAVQTAIRVRKAVSGLVVESRGYDTRVTVSIGIGTFDGRASGSPEELRRNANKALQEAKRRGKNQVWLYSHASEARAGDSGDSTGASGGAGDRAAVTVQVTLPARRPATGQ
ncbi:MAG: GGDEF domain-containing protein, partial [Planctomycetota bacterium]